MDDDYLRDVFAGVGVVSIRRMFGGKSVYSEGLIFALAIFDQVWIKADDESRQIFEAAGSVPFIYDGKSKPVIMPYWRLPKLSLEEPEEAARWARLGIAAARRRAQAAKAPRKRVKPGQGG